MDQPFDCEQWPGLSVSEIIWYVGKVHTGYQNINIHIVVYLAIRRDFASTSQFDVVFFSNYKKWRLNKWEVISMICRYGCIRPDAKLALGRQWKTMATVIS